MWSEMAEVGGTEAGTLTVSPFDLTTAVTATLYGPDGLAVAMLTPPATADLGHTWTCVAVYPTAGTYRRKWTVTGTGAGVVWEDAIIVKPAPALPSSVWPPTLREMKKELRVPESDTTYDEDYQVELDAAIAWYENRKRGLYNFDLDAFVAAEYDAWVLAGQPYPRAGAPYPTATHKLGVIRVAIRWQTRKRSPDGLVDQGELGQTRVPSFDPDIDRMLGVGLFSEVRFA